MIVDDLDALKTWLTGYLEPLCDADPAALSKYVVALIKKDKGDGELRAKMVTQMEVFLQGHTQEFIEVLFETLQSKSYADPEKAPAPLAIPPPLPPHPDEAAAAGDNDDGAKTPDSTTPTRTTTSSSTAAGHHHHHHHHDDDSGGGGGRRRGSDSRHADDRDRRLGPGPGHRSSRGQRRYRSRSRSPPRRASRSRSRSPGYGGSRRRQRSRSYSPAHRRGATNTRGSTPTKDEEDAASGAKYVPSKKPRCRDYDEKGFCMRGDLCKFDHGNDAVVLEDSAAAAQVPYLPASVGSSAYNADPYIPAASTTVLPPLHLPPPGYAVTVPPPTMAMAVAYDVNPLKRAYDGGIGPDRGGSYRGHHRPGFHRGYGRGGRGGRGRGGHGAGHGGGDAGGPTQLAVRNIPPEQNTIAHLNNHFARFGTLVNVQVHFESDPSSALVSFASPTEAERAFSSAEAVLGNRFIRMFYHYPAPPPRAASPPHKVRKDSEGNEVDAQTQKAAEKAAAIAAITANQKVLEDRVAQRKEATEKRLDSVKKAADLQRGKQELLDKLIDEQKSLIAKMEARKGSLKPEERAAMLALLKSIGASIDKTREEIKQALEKKGSIDLERDLLDAELELFQAQQDGADTGPILKRMAALRARGGRGAAAGGRGGGFRGGRGGRVPRGGAFPYGGRGGGFYGGRGAGRRGHGYSTAHHVTSVDRRPAKILVSGYELDEKDAVLEHFKKFGEVVDTTEDEATPSLVVHYKTRQEAEVAFKAGKDFADRLIQLSWHSTTASLEYSAEEDPSEQAEPEDDYTPLDPAYLPPGLEEEEEASRSLGSHENSASESGSKAQPDDDDDDDDDDDEEERSWKR